MNLIVAKQQILGRIELLMNEKIKVLAILQILI